MSNGVEIVLYEEQSEWRAMVTAKRKRSWLLHLMLLLFLLSLSACGGKPTAPVPPGPRVTLPPPSRPQSPNEAILNMLNNIKANGYDNDPAINNGLGGLWINWRYGTNPLQVNLNDSGDPDGPSVNPPRHDPLTDLRYVEALWMYKDRHPSDTQFDGELSRYSPIVKAEFGEDSHNQRGWVYDILIHIYHLSHDSFYQRAAHHLVDYLYNTYYHEDTGIFYQTKASIPNGYYRVDLALEDACAMLQEGTLSNQPEWKMAGHKILQQLYTTAYLPQYHQFLYMVSNIVLPDGRLNPAPTIYRDHQTHVDGGQVRMGAVGLETLSLLHAYLVTHDHRLLDDATDMLDPLTINNNALGLWDTKYQGYFSAALFSGQDTQNPGSMKISKGYKETGRQLQMLEAFVVANTLTNDRYQDMQEAMLQVALNKAYYPPQYGVLYQESVSWEILRTKDGKPLDFTTTEAMGIAFEALFSVGDTHPW
jgi:predicted small lipoprotein YifL